MPSHVIHWKQNAAGCTKSIVCVCCVFFPPGFGVSSTTTRHRAMADQQERAGYGGPSFDAGGCCLLNERHWRLMGAALECPGVVIGFMTVAPDTTLVVAGDATDLTSATAGTLLWSQLSAGKASHWLSPFSVASAEHNGSGCVSETDAMGGSQVVLAPNQLVRDPRDITAVCPPGAVHSTFKVQLRPARDGVGATTAMVTIWPVPATVVQACKSMALVVTTTDNIFGRSAMTPLQRGMLECAMVGTCLVPGATIKLATGDRELELSIQYGRAVGGQSQSTSGVFVVSPQTKILWNAVPATSAVRCRAENGRPPPPRVCAQQPPVTDVELNRLLSAAAAAATFAVSRGAPGSLQIHGDLDRAVALVRAAAAASDATGDPNRRTILHFAWPGDPASTDRVLSDASFVEEGRMSSLSVWVVLAPLDAFFPAGGDRTGSDWRSRFWRSGERRGSHRAEVLSRVTVIGIVAERLRTDEEVLQAHFGPAVLLTAADSGERSRRETFATLSQRGEPDAWNAIGGLVAVKDRLRRALIEPLVNPEPFRRFSIAPPRGVLLHGPPGCAKTSLVRGLCDSHLFHFIYVDSASLLSAFVGESEANLRAVFVEARRRSPSIIFFDEVEAIGRRRGETSADSDASVRLLATLLIEMDGVASIESSQAAASSRVCFVGATNLPGLLDPALLRPGRFDEIVEVPLPDGEARRDIVMRTLRLGASPPLSTSDGLGLDVDLDSVVRATDGCSGAELVDACRGALLDAVRGRAGAPSGHGFARDLTEVILAYAAKRPR